MTAFTSSAVIVHTNSAQLQAWINEIYTGLVTNCGLTQTADTGQDTVPSTAVYSATTPTVSSYYVFRFNDTLQATSPIYFKLEFGTSSAAGTAPGMWITVGTSTNGAGTIGGIAMVRSMIVTNGGQTSTVVSYPTNFCYNATQGVCNMSWKRTASNSSAAVSMGGFVIARSVNASGAPTADSCNMWTCSNTATAQGQGPIAQIINYNQSQLVPNIATFGQESCWVPFKVINTAQGSTAQVFPAAQYKGNASTPGWGITNAWGICIVTEFPNGTTFNSTILGSLSLTYVSTGSGCGNTTNLGGGQSLTFGTYSMFMLYQ